MTLRSETTRLRRNGPIRLPRSSSFPAFWTQRPRGHLFLCLYWLQICSGVRASPPRGHPRAARTWSEAPFRVLQGVDRVMKTLDRLAAGIGKQHQRPQRRTAQVWTMPNLRATVFVVGIKAKLHRSPFRHLITKIKCRNTASDATQITKK